MDLHRQHKTLYAQWIYIDSTNPTGSISSTNNVAASQTATLTLSDNVGVAGYYWGTSSNYVNNTYTTASSTSVTKTVSSAGTYYLTVKDTSGNLSGTVSITYYKTTLNANGGSVLPTSVLTEFGNYFTLPTPTRNGYSFSNWNTSSSGSGTGYTGVYTVNSNKTLFALWEENVNIYNLGEETYSFENYGDDDSLDGHCFGMSITSSGYYTGNLDITSIGGESCRDLHSMSDSATVRKPICYYQPIQGSYVDRSIVSGGSFEKSGYRNWDKSRDWSEMVAYVQNHSYDHNGSLQIGYWASIEYLGEEYIIGGHAINFLYYKKIDGQDRIYAYDNNYPDIETYFYMSSDGTIRQLPVGTFEDMNYGLKIASMSFCSISKYFELVEKEYSASHIIYSKEGEIDIDGAYATPLMTGFEKKQYYMYEIPDDIQEVTITPLVENAEFQYLDHNYSFGKIDEQTYGTLKVAKTNATPGEVTTFNVYNEPSETGRLRIFCEDGSFERQVRWWKKYSSETMSLGFLVQNCDKAVRYVWSSDSWRVQVDQHGNITNTGCFARSAKITLTAYDAFDRVVAQNTVSVRFYKFDWQNKRLQSQEVVSDNMFRSTVEPTASEPETLASIISAFISKVFRFKIK